MTVKEQKSRETSKLNLHAAAQLSRITHLLGFPTKEPAQVDYVKALTILRTADAITALVDDIVERPLYDKNVTRPRCPVAGEIRVMAYERLERGRAAIAACSLCAGEGVVTAWYLVTYRHGSFVVEKAQRLRHVTTLEHANKEAHALAARIAADPNHARQAIISAAAKCVCMALTT